MKNVSFNLKPNEPFGQLNTHLWLLTPLLEIIIASLPNTILQQSTYVKKKPSKKYLAICHLYPVVLLSYKITLRQF